ncbi:ATP-binding protein [Streptomyces sp. NBC_01808]|uniref:ATP-binding protein n=1 Tax=Streptomyces sp. NBC_01808 TaxID=2975947 RepID=UPI002DD86A81|nr:ATP-binding protein [Streptomyces sp. NBC_01808]WSA39351.1 ATP-binding protein [Streptomyces sp. NBC_01808]
MVLPGRSTTTPGCAREIVRSWLGAWQIPAERAYDALVIASELTTNALVHTDSSQIVVAVQLTGRELRRLTVRVVDQGPARTARAVDRRDGPGDDLALSGRGLAMVEALADRWGAVRRSAGTSVWAQLAVPAICSHSPEGNQW